ncbi:MAG: AAA family ATPase [Candidatus Marinimicrobia bacterium]|nr:AAA family ATPase [Candidatus Neomarinimicrobiota bacterium]
MIDIELVIKNYRCFPDKHPLKINIKNEFIAFVGCNNSGKSSVLKFFHEFRTLFSNFSGDSGWSTVIGSQGGAFSDYNSVKDKNEIFTNTNNRDLIIELRIRKLRNKISYENTLIQPDKIILTFKRDTTRYFSSLFAQGNEIELIKSTVTKEEDAIFSTNALRIDVSDFREVFKRLANNIYIAAYRNLLSVSSETVYYDINIGMDVVKRWKTDKTGDNIERNNFATKLEDDIASIFGFKSLSIDASEDEKTFKIRINRKPYKLSDIGAGFAQFLVTLINIGMRQPSFVLIDEPELNLHPKLQIAFLTTLAGYAEEGVLFATHSIGLARACADQVFSIKRLSEGISQMGPLETTPSLPEFLGELGFSGYKELGFEKVLLVEGSTDIKTYQQFLRQFDKDQDIVVLSLGGSDMINGEREYELDEIKRITNEIYSVIDSEKDKKEDTISTRRLAFIESCKKVGINCHILEKRATENYLVDRAIRKIKGDKYRELAPFEKLSDLDIAWAKHENWRIAREMNFNEVAKTDLGKYLKAI